MTVPHYMAGVDRDYQPRERRRSRKSKLDRMLERIEEQQETKHGERARSASVADAPCGTDAMGHVGPVARTESRATCHENSEREDVNHAPPR